MASIHMKISKRKDIALVIFLLLLLPFLIVATQIVKKYIGRAYTLTTANITIFADRPLNPLAHNWKTLAQGGEEQGVQMIAPVISKVSLLEPRYIRIDHIYDFYDVVQQNSEGEIYYDWSNLDKTVCDILYTGAKPFFSLGYMPQQLSKDGSLISVPNNWQDWQVLVQQTIERYSGMGSVICGNDFDEHLDDVYYEVWNEPDLETFGKWSIHGGEKDYKLLYFYSAKGAENAQNTRNYFFGGPAITAAYQNWFQLLIKYVDALNLRLDFLSWHHYGTEVDKFGEDMRKIDMWLSDPDYEQYRLLPRIISEWGYDSGTNPLSETNVAAAHTISAIRYLIEEKLEMAFAFEIKDGETPRWGILSNKGIEKPRYHALRMLNVLGNVRLQTEGEGSFVKVIASRKPNGTSVILVNYDQENQHIETVPFKIVGLTPGEYFVTRESLNGENSSYELIVDESGTYSELIYMEPNSLVSFDLERA